MTIIMAKLFTQICSTKKLPLLQQQQNQLDPSQLQMFWLSRNLQPQVFVVAFFWFALFGLRSRRATPQTATVRWPFCRCAAIRLGNILEIFEILKKFKKYPTTIGTHYLDL
jgi:hypothetical protein